MSALHFAGVAGVFMSALAYLAREKGIAASGSDSAFYPPAGDFARALGMELFDGYEAAAANAKADLFVVGNAISRGNPLAERILNEDLPCVSGPQWLYENVLRGRKVLAVAGTHGKTTTSSLLAHILDAAGMKPGFVLGGIAGGFDSPARIGEGEWFVAEADEYDSAFFDKRPKFMHYRPRIAAINNLEFDHADIYANEGEIVRQFHYLLRTVPAKGAVVANIRSPGVRAVLQKGAHSPVIKLFGDGNRDDNGNDKSNGWHWRFDGKEMTVFCGGKKQCAFLPPLAGAANRDNILTAVVAANAAGADSSRAGEYLRGYKPPLRRLQTIATAAGITVTDDFAHHPSAFCATLAALKEKHPGRRVIAVFEARSNSMKAGVFQNELADSLRAADLVFACAEGLQWSMEKALAPLGERAVVARKLSDLPARVLEHSREGDCILLMSNGNFGGIAQKITAALRAKEKEK